LSAVVAPRNWLGVVAIIAATGCAGTSMARRIAAIAAATMGLRSLQPPAVSLSRYELCHNSGAGNSTHAALT